MASFPGSVKTFATRTSGQTIDPAHINDLQDEVNAIEDGYLNATARLNSSNSTLARLSVTGGSTLAGGLNSSNSTLAALSVTGGSTLASSITIGTLPYIFPATGGSTGQTLAISSTSGSTMTLGWVSASAGAMTRLAASNGTTTTATAENVATVAISGLTANDTIVIYFTMDSITQQTANTVFYSTTDSLTVAQGSGAGAITAGTLIGGTATIRQAQNSATRYVGHTVGVGASAFNQLVDAAATTAWTGSWTLALRQGGVTSGGTFRWSWAVYKIAGQ